MPYIKNKNPTIWEYGKFGYLYYCHNIYCFNMEPFTFSPEQIKNLKITDNFIFPVLLEKIYE